MKASIDNNLDVMVEGDNYSDIVYEDDRCFILGTLYGGFDGEKIYDRDSVIRTLVENSGDLAKIKEIIKYSTGSFFIIIKNGDVVTLFIHPSCEGLYYKKNKDSIFLSDNEGNVFKLSSLDNLDQKILLDFILNPRWHEYPLFSTFFKDVKRVNGGCYITVGKNLRICYKNFFLESPETYNPRRFSGYDKLKKSFNSFAEVIAGNSGKKDVYVLFSGGVDSLNLVLSFLKTNLDVHPLFWDEDYAPSAALANALSDELDLKLEVLSSKLLDSHKSRIEENYKSFIEYLVFETITSPELQAHFDRKGVKKPLLICGDHMDDLYHVRKVALATVGRIFNPKLDALISASAIFPFSPPSLWWQKQRKSVYNHLLYKLMYPQISKNKDHLTLIPFLKSIGVYGWLDSLPVQYLSYLVHSLRFCSEEQSEMVVQKHYNAVYDFNVEYVTSHSYLLNHFLSHELSLKDLFKTKYQFYMYADEVLKDRCGKTFYGIARETLDSFGFRPSMFNTTRAGLSYVKNRLSKPRSPSFPGRVANTSERNVFMMETLNMMLDDNHTPILSNKPEMRYLFEKVKNKDANVSSGEYCQIQKLVNLEVYLGNLFK